MKIRAGEVEVELLAERAVHISAWKMLLVSDLHLTKDAHFRKHGIAIPSDVTKATLKRLETLITNYSPSRLLVLGDMFHSEANEGMQQFADWRKQFVHLSLELVPGNHDLLGLEHYTGMGITFHPFRHRIEELGFCHDPAHREERFTFTGHLHPAVKLRGMARQRLHLPCYWWRKDHVVLPAFGEFTGSKAVKPMAGDRVFALAGNEVIEID